MAEGKRDIRATSRITARIDVSIDPNKLNPVEYLSYHDALMALKNIHQTLSSMEIESKSHTDIEKESNQYRITCRMVARMLETTDEDVCDFGKYEIIASIVLTTDSTGSLIADSNSELVKLVHDIEKLCREKGQVYAVH